MRALADHRKGRMRAWLDRLSGIAPAAGSSILRSRLFIKYVVLFVIVVGLALAANALFDIYFSYQEQKTSLVRIQREQAEAAAGKIGQFISEIESQVGWTTQLPWSASTLEQRRFDALRLLRQVPAITELAEIDSTGHEQLRVSRLAMEVVGSGNDVSKEPAFTEAVAHKVYYGPVYFRRESEPYMTLSLAGTRRDTGVSIAQVNLKLIWDVLSRIKFAGHGRAYVVDAAGRLIAHPDISLVLRNTDMSQLAQVKSARAKVAGNTGEQVQEAEDIGGHKVLTASAPVAPLGWLVFVDTPIEEAYAPLYASIERAGLVLLGALALAFAAGMFLARRMVVPIQALRAGAARIGAGDLGQRIAIKTGDEVEALADQFNDMAGRLQESYADLEHKVEVRTHELSESLEQQTATSDVLSVISRSPGDLRPVFDTMLANAARLCGAQFGNLVLSEGEGFRLGAMYNPPPGFAEHWRLMPMIRPGPLAPIARLAATKRPVHITDLTKDEGYKQRDPIVVALVELAGAHSLVAVPLLKDGEIIGAFIIYRPEVGPFTDKQIELLKNFASQAVIAIENARLLSELRESLAQQTATSEVLSVISSSPGDLKPVFDAMLGNAARLCEAQFGNLILYEDGVFRITAMHNMTPAFAEQWQRDPVFRPGPLAPVSRAIATGDFVHIVDLTRDQAYVERDPPVVSVVELGGARSILVVPMLKEGETLGALSIFRQEVRPFTEKQIDLIKNFAAQAVIAIENTRLLSELRELLAQQTATADVLKVISGSAFDLQMVLDTLVESAARLCAADKGVINKREGEAYRVVASHGYSPKMKQFFADHLLPPDRGSITGRAALEGKAIHIPDVLADPEYRASDYQEMAGYRSVFCVPLIREGVTIGVFGLLRDAVNPFTEKQIELVTTFADQAVIAIENVRLFEAEQQRTRELTESLEQQTATSQVLQVISSSPGDLAPVFAAMLENAVRISGAKFGIIHGWDGETLRLLATHDLPPGLDKARRSAPDFKPGPKTGIRRMATTRSVIHIPDLREDPGYLEETAPQIVAAVEIGGVRTMLAVPMLKENGVVGAFTVYRQEVRPFTEKQIELVKNFAAQAVIAIENARLLSELRESLAQQTATADVLGVINASRGDLQPVFEAMVEKARRLCEADAGHLAVPVGDDYRSVAVSAMSPEMTELIRSMSYAPGRGTAIGRALAECRPIQISDIGADNEHVGREAAHKGFIRTILGVPLLREGEAIGAFGLSRQRVEPFTERQIDLVRNFAAQAVIAIENTRLLTELRESLEQQTATADVLRVISSSPGQLAPVFAAILDNATRICQANFGTLFLREGEALRVAAHHGSLTKAWDEQWRVGTLIQADASLQAFQTLSGRQPLQVVDLSKASSYLSRNPKAVNSVEVGGIRTMVTVPMLKDSEAIGVITIFRTEVREFTDKQIALVTSFAAQAVIAIENARLLTELRESLDQQTATSNLLSVISSSPGDLEPVFRTMLENGTRICQAHFGVLSLREGAAMRVVAMHNAPPAYAELRRREPTWTPTGEMARIVTQAVADKQAVQVPDLAVYSDDDPLIRLFATTTGARSLILVPLLKEGEVIGSSAIYRQEVRPFTDKQVELLTNFAAQAVIAIENTRLLTELRERTDELGRSVGELRALGEVSQAVNSTLDLETVLSTIVTKAVQLSNTGAGAIYVFDEGDREFHLRATYGMDRELIDALSQRHIGLNETVVTAALAHRDPIQVADLREDVPNPINEITIRAGYRARLTAPLFRGDEVVGLLVVRRRTPGAFPPNTVDLIKTFAAQSVLAIQNARLFHEIEDKRRELEVAGQHKSQFLANMSHELRTPLNAIIGYSEILQEEVTDLGQQDLVPDLKKVEGAGRHLLGLINDILDLSKVEAGKMDVFLEDVEIVPLLEEVRALIAPLAEKNGNALELRPAENLGSMHTDRTKLKQSLLNILSNGSKFTQNGRLTLVAERFEGDRALVRFAISDTGIGMTEDQIGRLFQAFSQADASTTKKYGGTGLGLAISRQFCQLLGGDITVTSRPGEGSTFTITLPAHSDEPAQINPADAPRIAADATNAATVLIVDDDPAARELLSATLKNAGYRLVHAGSGDEALKLARAMRPDVITLDVMMPKPDGWEVLSALKADDDLCDIPVVMVTMVPDRGIGLSLGAIDILTKPVDRARLTALIHRLVRREGPVLVVEDDAATRDMMRHTIEKLGLAVAEANNGRVALSWLGQHAPPAMVLLDLMMPEMDGFEFLDAIATRAEWREIPAVVVTAKQLTAVERDRLSRQARNVMEKATATKVDIAAAISAAVRRRPARVPTAAK